MVGLKKIYYKKKHELVWSRKNYFKKSTTFIGTKQNIFLKNLRIYQGSKKYFRKIHFEGSKKYLKIILYLVFSRKKNIFKKSTT